jgi:hypothetical protein
MLTSRNSAAMIGRQYLLQYTGDTDVERMFTEFLATAPEVSEALQAGSSSDVRHAVFSQYRDDYACGRTVTIDGWLFSATEARICALAALTDG